jgi:general L-amino acid transport system permease protein
LPEVRNSLSMPGGIYLNNRGLIVPNPVTGDNFWLVGLVFWAGVLGALFYRSYAKKKQEKTGVQSPIGLVTLGLVFGLPLVVFFLAGMPLSFEYATAGRFNITGGVTVLPEFLALLFGLVIYTAGFIAEAVRAGIQAVSKGQTEASYALGLKPKNTLNLVIIPQAMRVIIPPMTSHYLNLTKNSSLAVFVGYPDLVNIFTGTVLNQTGQAIEVVAITMLVYLTISLTTSLFMNWYNARKALVER